MRLTHHELLPEAEVEQEFVAALPVEAPQVDAANLLTLLVQQEKVRRGAPNGLELDVVAEDSVKELAHRRTHASTTGCRRGFCILRCAFVYRVGRNKTGQCHIEGMERGV